MKYKCPICGNAIFVKDDMYDAAPSNAEKFCCSECGYIILFHKEGADYYNQKIIELADKKNKLKNMQNKIDDLAKIPVDQEIEENIKLCKYEYSFLKKEVDKLKATIDDLKLK